MVTHSDVLAREIPWTEEPGGPPSMGSHSRARLKRLSSSSRVLLNCLKVEFLLVQPCHYFSCCGGSISKFVIAFPGQGMSNHGLL